MTSRRRLRLSRSLVWLAAAAGVLHAAASLYWALGGQWLLATVGQWAVEASARSPAVAGAGLGLVALVKLLAATVPVAVAYGRVSRPRPWRAVSWAGGLLLVAYGGVNVVVSNAVLLGAIRPDGGYDAEAMRGHAHLWDPLFLLWGGALVLSLGLSRGRPAELADAGAEPSGHPAS
ncbi:DUF3995 domain-containing protein [uncultured Pseudokineococcus sp.]|uniref:DUF3995 domain-containing protein n=1 Tax=uncultured Pseudokineococcus sp. TaxID=1642928 RepID=UPI0026080DBE|nr:DUF3995 domain-containing protein [uncultured Pseudokineococcus sp.]